MPALSFGKYKGVPLNLVPLDYLKYMAGEIRSESLRRLITSELAKRGGASAGPGPRPAAHPRLSLGDPIDHGEDGFDRADLGAMELPKVIRERGEHFVITMPPKPALRAALGRVPGRWYHGALCTCGKCFPPRNYWTVPLSKPSLGPLLSFAEEWGFSVQAPSLEAARKDLAERKLLAKMSAALDGPAIDFTSVNGYKPYPYQLGGISYLRRVKRGMVADEMGLGKTVQALGAAVLEEAFPLVIVCPASLKLKWKDECAEWVPGKWAQVLTSGKDRPKGYPITILNYDLLTVEGERAQTSLVGVGERVAALRPKGLIYDEAHYLKTPSALRTRGAAILARGVPFVFLLTGTPVLNRPAELMAQLRIMGRLEDLGGHKNFATRYCGARVVTRTIMREGEKRQIKTLDTKGHGNLEELNREMRQLCFVRRLKRDVMPQLPAIQRSLVSLEISNRREYDAAKANLVEWLKREGRGQTADRAGFNERAQRLNVLRKLAVRGKWEQACQWVEEFLESGEKIVIFAYHRDVVEGLAVRFKAPKVYGDTPQPERHRINQEFQAGKHQVLVMNITSGGVGLNLTAASNVAFFEWGWTPGENDQAEARVYGRANDPHGATAWYFRGRETVEDDHLELLVQKRKIVEGASDGRVTTKDSDMVELLLSRLLRQ